MSSFDDDMRAYAGSGTVKGPTSSASSFGSSRARMPGNLVAIDVPERGREWMVLGEWPERGA